MQLANALKLNNKAISGFSLNDISSLVAWYKFNTGLTHDSFGLVSNWADSSNNTSVNMDMDDNTAAYKHTSLNFITFDTTLGSVMKTSTSGLTLTTFTAFIALDVQETNSAGDSPNNEVVIGCSGDQIRIYKGSQDDVMRVRLNGVITDITLTSAQPTGTYILMIARDISGALHIYIDNSQVGLISSGTASTALSNTFDFCQIGDGSADMLIYEVAIFDTSLEGTTEMTTVFNDIKDRVGF